MLGSVAFLTLAAAPASARTCGASGAAVAHDLRALPTPIREALAGRLADYGQPFEVGDAIPAGQPRRPSMRLIYGYATPTGYVVEREQGGRGYNVGKIVFDKAAQGYIECR